MDKILIAIKIGILSRKLYRVFKPLPYLYLGLAFIYNWSIIYNLNEDTRRLLLGSLFLVNAVRKW